MSVHENLIEQFAYRMMPKNERFSSQNVRERSAMEQVMSDWIDEEKRNYEAPHVELYTELKTLETKRIEEWSETECVIYALYMTQVYQKYEVHNIYKLHKSYPSPRSLYPIQIYLFDHQHRMKQGTDDVFFFHARHLCLKPISVSSNSFKTDGFLSLVLQYDFDHMPYYYNYLRKALCYMEMGHLLGNLDRIFRSLSIRYRVEFQNDVPVIHLFSQKADRVSSLDALRSLFIRRSSGIGPWGIYPQPYQIPSSFVSDLFSGIEHGIRCGGFDAETAALLAESVSIYFTAHSVEGMNDGMYRFTSGSLPYVLIREGNWNREMESLYSYPGSINFMHMNFVFCFAVDFNKLLRTFGTDYYTYLHLYLGFIAEQIMLEAGRQDLFARPYKSFFQKDTDQFFDLHTSSQVSQYQLMIGKNRYQDFVCDLRL